MRILTFALCLLCFSVSAQNNSINVYPWNPDSDNDNQIGVDDLQSFLTVYGNSFGLPPEPCTYDGTELEEWIGNWINGDIIVDSIYVEYEVEDISSFFIAGCPDQVSDTLILSGAYLLTYTGPYAETSLGTAYGGYQLRLSLIFSASLGT